VTWKKFLPKSQDFCPIRRTKFLILDKVELRDYQEINYPIALSAGEAEEAKI
jgi:hypothetical protein